MRVAGSAVIRPAVSEHACWAYSSDAERAALASNWLAEGLKLGQRAMYVADLEADELVSELSDVPDRDDAIAAGALVVRATNDAYDTTRAIDPEAQLAMYSGAVDRAIADGFEGLRVAADITTLVADKRRRASHAQWEQFADRYMSEHPLAPICMHDTRVVDDIAVVACVHPQSGPEPAPFAMFARAATEATIEGELDAMTADTLMDALRGLPATDESVDVGSLGFIDAHSAGVLNAELVQRRDAGQRIVVTGASPILRRIWAICDFDASLLSPA